MSIRVRTASARLLVILALACSLVLGTGAAGNASVTTTVGDSVEVTFSASPDPDLPLPEQQVDCSLVGRFETSIPEGPGSPAPVAVLPYKLRCTTGYNVSYAYFLNLRAQGDTCIYNSVPGQVDGQALVTGTMTGGPASPCSVDQVCWTLSMKWHTGIGSDADTYSGCENWALGTPPEPPAPATNECQYGAPGPGPGLATFKRGPDTSQRYGDFASLDFHVEPGSLPNNGVNWWAYVLLDYDLDDVADTGWINTTGFESGKNYPVSRGSEVVMMRRAFHNPPEDLFIGSSLPLTQSLAVATSERYGGSAASPGTEGRFTVVGAGLVRLDPNLINTTTGTLDQFGNRYPQPTVSVPRRQGVLGINDPAHCTFYWGQKVIDIPTVTVDDPGGPLAPIPVDPEVPEPLPDPSDPIPPAGNPCDFSFTDPSTWASAGICVLIEIVRDSLGVLRDIKAGITGMGAAIANAITGALEGLFVPDKSVLEAKVNQVKSAWGGTAPMAFLDGVGDVAAAVNIPEQGGCQGPAWSFSNPITHSGVTLYPLSSCSGAVSTLATIVKSGLTALVFVGGFLASVRIIASSVGLQVSIGRGGDD